MDLLYAYSDTPPSSSDINAELPMHTRAGNGNGWMDIKIKGTGNSTMRQYTPEQEVYNFKVHLHAGFMSVAWLFFAPMGIIFVVFFKNWGYDLKKPISFFYF